MSIPTSTSNEISLFTSTLNVNDEISSTMKLNFEKEEWINLNRSNLNWKRIEFNSSYKLQSENECQKKMCSNTFVYNGLFLNRYEGCLSFILSITGQPSIHFCLF